MDNVLHPVIREMNDFDIDGVFALWHKLAEDQFIKNKYIVKNRVQQFDIHEYFSKCLKNKNCKVFVAEYKRKSRLAEKLETVYINVKYKLLRPFYGLKHRLREFRKTRTSFQEDSRGIDEI